MRCGYIVCASLLLACGSRTGVEPGDGPERGAVPFDAGFDTFPCRWSLAQATEIGLALDWVDLHGAVHGRRDEVVVLGRDTGTGRVGVSGTLLALGDPPRVLERLEPEAPLPLLGHPEGWVQLGTVGSDCQRVDYDDAFAPFLSIVLSGECVLEANDPQHLDVTWRVREGVHVVSERLPEMILEGEALVPVSADHQRAVRLEGLGWIVLTLEDGWLHAYRVPEEGEVRRARLAPQGAPFAVALDRVRPSALVLREEDGWHLERIPFEGEPRLVPLADLSTLPAPPLGSLASNETEAMFPLADGRVAIAPTDGSALRYVGPVAEAPVGDLQVVLRPGSSAGGLLYTEARGRQEMLLFRPLTCNR